MATPETNVLAELIGSKHACLVQLHELGRRQLDLIDRGDMTALLDLLVAKQRSILKLQQLETALDPFRRQDPQQRRWPSPEDRSRCAEQLQQCQTLLSEIIDQEKRSERALVRRRDDLATRLQGTHLADQARGAYSAQAHNELSQLDLLTDT
jgi:hypothetical protein